jgi:hypothetical protein
VLAWRRVLKDFLVPLPLIDYQLLFASSLFFQIPQLTTEHNHHYVRSFSQAQDPSDGRIRPAHRFVCNNAHFRYSSEACCNPGRGLTNLRFINNEFVKSVDGKTFDVINPSTEEVICQVQEASEKDVDIAVAAARKAFNGPWRKMTPDNRGRLLVKLADLFEKNADLLASVEALDNGKAFSMAKNVDVPASAGCLRYYGGWADKIEGKVVDTTPDTFNYIRKEPVSSPLLHCHIFV